MVESLNLPALRPETVALKRETDYPGDFKKIVAGRARRALGEALGLGQFGVNLVHLAPGSASAQRHWHLLEDEFIVILGGEVVLNSNAGEQTLRAGEVAGFPAGKADGHHLRNESGEEAVYLEIGSRVAADVVEYPDIDLVYRKDTRTFTDKRGKAY